MNLDLRWPLGFVFALFGAILVGYGLLGDASLYRRSLGINVNLVWGLVVLLFGLLMLLLARRSKKRRKE